MKPSAKRLLHTTPLVLAMALIASPAWSAPSVDDGDADVGNGGGVEIPLMGDTITNEELDQIASSTGTPYVSVPVGFFDLDTLGDPDENYGWCMDTAWRAVGDRDPETVRAEAATTYEMLYTQDASWHGIGLGQVDWYLPCETDPIANLPLEVVEQTVREVAFAQLPRPEPSVPPGFGLAGLRMFLVTDHDLDFGPETTTVDLGPLALDVTFSGTGSTTVDWGDGTVTDHDVPGTPYPDGQITHVWTHTGDYDLTVTDHWTVDYDVADGTFVGRIEGTLDPVTLPALEVTERRAIRTR